jgi:hypothetical protein
MWLSSMQALHQLGCSDLSMPVHSYDSFHKVYSPADASSTAGRHTVLLVNGHVSVHHTGHMRKQNRAACADEEPTVE